MKTNENILHTCCFIGHREIDESDQLKERLRKEIERLIEKENIDTFLFGSKSRFNDLCYQTVTRLKDKYPHIKRIYVRAEYEHINDNYTAYLLGAYQQTYYPKNIMGAGKAAYVKRNFEMIIDSRFCIFYYDENYNPQTRKSGTKIALDYAIKLNKEIIRL